METQALGCSGIEEADVPDTLLRAREGDEEAFHAIFIRYSKPILSFIYSLLGDRACSEDLTQETFVRAYRRLDSMHEGTRLSTWLFGIARNVVREFFREKYRSRQALGLDDPRSRRAADQRVGPDEFVSWRRNWSGQFGKPSSACRKIGEWCLF